MEGKLLSGHFVVTSDRFTGRVPLCQFEIQMRQKETLHEWILHGTTLLVGLFSPFLPRASMKSKPWEVSPLIVVRTTVAQVTAYNRRLRLHLITDSN